MANTETAVTVIEPSRAIQVNLDAYPTSRFNRVIPVQTIGLGSDLIKPIIQAVALERGKHTYKSPDIPAGNEAINKPGLDALASVAGVDFPEERRLDDGSDPSVCGVQVRAEMLLPTGRRIVTTGTKWTHMGRMRWASPAQEAKYREKLYEHTSSRARNRAIRALLSLNQSYPIAELAKPFAVVSFVPNMDHPEIRSRILDAMAPAIAASYGPGGRAPAQLEAGVTEVDEIPEDDDFIEGESREAPATPTTLPGEKLAAASNGSTPAEPSWITGAAAAEPPDFATSLRDTADAVEGGDKRAGKDELAALGQLFDGWQGTGVIAGGFAAIWPDTDVEKLTVGQAHAMVTVADSMGPEAFQAAWREAAQAKAGAST